MKSTYYTYRFNRIIILISIFLLILSFAVNGQNRSRNGDKNHDRNGSAKVERNGSSRNARTSYNYDRRNTNSRSTSNQGRYIERNEKPKKQTYTYKESNYKNQNFKYNKSKAYHKKHHHMYKNPYYHKKYYHYSPWTYYNYPVVFYHKSFGEYYYHSGRFYQYDWRNGYYAVDMPTHVFFNTIPHGYSRVYINGRLFYQYNDIYFRDTPFGYRIVPHSSGIYISARF